MKLKKLHIENYKNLKHFDLDFENDNGLSIIVGNNGSGKSNILEAISGIFCEWYGKVKYTFPPLFFYIVFQKVHKSPKISFLSHIFRLLHSLGYKC